MTQLRPRSGILGRLECLVLAGVLAAIATPAPAQSKNNTRQVTLFGIVATPGTSRIDPKLASIEPQLRKLLPNHGFRLLDAQNRRLLAGQKVTCQLGGGFTAEAILIQSLDDDGKVELNCSIVRNDLPQFNTVVATPPNQLFFCDKPREDGSHILIGVGAR